MSDRGAEIENSAFFRHLELELDRGQEGVRVLLLVQLSGGWLLYSKMNPPCSPLQKDRLSHGEAELP